MGAIFDVVGGFVQAEGIKQQGKAEKAAAYDEALQLEAKGKEDFAASQRDMLAKRKEGELVNSRIQALAAASGGGADDPTIVKLMTGVAEESEYNAQSAIYGGASRRKGLFGAAKNRRMGGDASLLGSKYAAAGAILGGISSAAGKMIGSYG